MFAETLRERTRDARENVLTSFYRDALLQTSLAAITTRPSVWVRAPNYAKAMIHAKLVDMGFQVRFASAEDGLSVNLSGWDNPDSTGRCGELFSLYDQAVQRHRQDVETILGGIQKMCWIIAQSGKTQYVFKEDPSRYWTDIFGDTHSLPVTLEIYDRLRKMGLTVSFSNPYVTVTW